MARIFGYKVEELINSDIKILMHKVDATGHDRYMDIVKSGSLSISEPKGKRLPGKHKNGNTLDLLIRVSKNAGYHVAYFTDLSKLQTLESA